MNSAPITRFPIETPKFGDLMPSLQRSVRDIMVAAKRESHPFGLHTTAIPGSGKSSVTNAISDQLRADGIPHTLLGFDRIMKALPEYQELAARDLEAALDKYEIPARQAGYLVAKLLMTKRASFIWDHTGHLEEHIDALGYAKGKGFKVAVLHIVAGVDVVKRRIMDRQKAENRFTPLKYVDERVDLIEGLQNRFKIVADDYIEIENPDLPGTEIGGFFQQAGREVGAHIQALRSGRPIIDAAGPRASTL